MAKDKLHLECNLLELCYLYPKYSTCSHECILWILNIHTLVARHKEADVHLISSILNGSFYFPSILEAISFKVPSRVSRIQCYTIDFIVDY